MFCKHIHHIFANCIHCENWTKLETYRKTLSFWLCKLHKIKVQIIILFTAVTDLIDFPVSCIPLARPTWIPWIHLCHSSQTLTQLHQKLTCLWLCFRVEIFRLDGWTLLTVNCQANPAVPPPKNKSVFDSSTTAMGVHCSALQKTQLQPQSNWHPKKSPQRIRKLADVLSTIRMKSSERTQSTGISCKQKNKNKEALCAQGIDESLLHSPWPHPGQCRQHR